MLALLFCILASTVISLIFKWFKHFKIRNLPAIVVNYFVCVVCGSLFQGEFPLSLEVFDQPWLPLAFVLGFFFIGGFNLNALSVQLAGVAVTSVVQRISLLLSVSFAFFFYHELMTGRQLIGIAAGLAAVLLSVRLGGNSSTGKRPWLLPLGVFVIAGLIESLLTVAQRSYGADGDVTFTVTLFCWAGVLGLLSLAIQSYRTQESFIKPKEVIGGITLGIPNFFSIHLILVALGKGLSAAIVFPVLNVATIVLSTLLALVFFNERLSPKQWFGVVLAILAILLITL